MQIVDRIYFSAFQDIANEQFDYVVIGAGAYGTSFAHRMLELNSSCKILVLDKGDYLIPDHIQNLPATYVNLNSDVGVRPWKSTGDMNFMPQIPYVGGRALLWNAWIPQPTPEEMPGWPPSVIKSLEQEWYQAGEYLGRRYDLKTAGNENQPLADQMRKSLFANLANIDTALPTERPCELDSSMATGQDVPASIFAKFAPVQVLINDIQKYSGRLKAVVNCAAKKLVIEKGLATALETVQGNLDLRGAKVVLALNTIEAAALTIKSLPKNPLIGKNLSGHIRSWLAFRVRRNELNIPDRFQATAFYLPGVDATLDRFLHTHISAVYNPFPKEDLAILYKVLPDASSQQAIETYQDPNYVVYMLHVMGEFLGEPTAKSWNYVTVDGDETVVNVSFQKKDREFWASMDKTAYQIVSALANGPIEYQQADGSWSSFRPANIHNTGLVHESGTLWMGSSPKTSVSSVDGMMHEAKNVFGTGGMLFPRPGSWNPTFTGIAMAFGLARRFARS